MPDCRSKNSSKLSQTCPECGSNSKSVKMRTLYHQLHFPENKKNLLNSPYFCPLPSCPVAYFSTTGRTIPTTQLKTSEEIKKNKLCFCFDIDTDIYYSALGTERAHYIKEFVIQRTKLKDCACEIRNPSGQCCLADFKRVEAKHALLNV
ncbi:MAG: hypothetical protein HFP81_09790 [Methylococcales symbiont of Hymedesmia sp. n. MRB-2018]|nr:MAG: hypothetical protein HFP78_04560 [Methylococcales symbiont of Hymedesmia sp. n. MRB-2018]KAF3983000.1 MAG: hypothetical protein HFP81_09790 [Methylococcales symbiont of Hymedesmia sp. n. MRB-2018]